MLILLGMAPAARGAQGKELPCALQKRAEMASQQWQPTPVFLPGESQGQRSLVGCRLWGRTESDMTEAT